MTVLNSIKKTLTYSRKYGGNLTEKQLFERLISSDIYTKEEIGNLIKQSLHSSNTTFDREALKKEKKTKELAKLIEKKFKDILYLGVTGSVAAGYPKKNDDIDIVIVTKINKLWLTRLRLRFFILKNKIPHRRFGKRENKDDFCFNLWLDEKSIKLKKEKQTLKNGMDLIMMIPLINRKKTYEKMLCLNDWAKKYVATGYNEKISNFQFPISKKNRKEKILDKTINWLMFWPQFWYMKKRIKNEKIDLHEAFFHH